MYLDQRGDVRACCMNDFHVLGNVTEQSLPDIWRGEEAQSLRRAMEAHDLGLGCDFCQWQPDGGRFGVRRCQAEGRHCPLHQLEQHV